MKVNVKHKLTINSSMVHEVLSVIIGLLQPDTYNHIIDLGAIIKSTDKDLEALKVMNDINLRPLKIMEFALVIDFRDDINSFFDRIDQLNHLSKIQAFLGFEYELEEIEIAMKNKAKFKRLLKSCEITDDEKAIEVFRNIDNILNSYRSLALKIKSSEAFISIFDEKIVNDYETSMLLMQEDMNERHPLSYAQEVMGKNFWTISDYDEYEFIPVYFSSGFPKRFANSLKHIQLKPLYLRVLSDDETQKQLIETLKILSDSNRLKILNMTYRNPMYGKDIADALGVTTATISHHLEVMRKKGLLHMEKDRHIKYFSTNNLEVVKFLEQLKDYIL